MAGAVSAGMCAALEARGLIDSFDVIYGSSAGALNASYTAAGQAQQRLGLYVQATRQRLIDPRRALLGRPAFRSDGIFASLLLDNPHASDVLGRAPGLKVIATRVQDKGLEVLDDFASLAELRTALRASCSIPGITGNVVEFREAHYVDGALVDSLPYRAALRGGATHVLVLRTRHAGWRQREIRGGRRLLADRLLRDAPATVVELCHALPARYNAAARDLAAPDGAGLAGRVAQLAPPAHARPARQLESHPRRVLAAIAVGARTVHEALAEVPGADSRPAAGGVVAVRA
jgi:predicted acylesterase/phospholipase RssA